MNWCAIGCQLQVNWIPPLIPPGATGAPENGSLDKKCGCSCAAIQIHSKVGRFFAFRMWGRCHKHFWRSAAKRDGTLSVPIGFTPLTARARSSLGPPSQRSSPPFNKQWFVAIESQTLSGDQSSTANLKKSLYMRWVPSVSMYLITDKHLFD